MARREKIYRNMSFRETTYSKKVQYARKSEFRGNKFEMIYTDKMLLHFLLMRIQICNLFYSTHAYCSMIFVSVTHDDICIISRLDAVPPFASLWKIC